MRMAVAAVLCLASAALPAETPVAGRLTLTTDLGDRQTGAAVAFPVGMLAGPPEYGASLVLCDSDGQPVPCQLDDLDGDLRPDEVFFLIDLPATGAVKLTATWRTDPLPPTPPQVAALIGYGRVTRAALESKLQGYYLEGPATLDVIGKLLVPKLTGDWFFGSEPHDPQRFSPGKGMDFLPVGDTMGAGGFALLEDPDDPQTLSRPWPTAPGEAELLWDVVSTGPLRAVVRTRIWNWQGQRGTYAATVLHLMVAGRRYCESRIRFDQLPPNVAGVRLAAGVRRLDGEVDCRTGDGWLAASGQEPREPRSRERDQWVGLGLLYPAELAGEAYLAAANGPNHVVPLGAVDGPPTRLYHLAAWDRDGGIASATGWRRTVADLAEELRHPVRVVVER